MIATSDPIVLCTPLRTAVGKLGGTLRDVAAVDLGAHAAREVLSRSGADPSGVDEVIIGSVLQAGQGMNPGRQVALRAGLGAEVPGMTVNRVCGSGLQAIVSGARLIRCGEARLVLAGGIESMNRAPFLLPKARHGYRMGTPNAELLDSMVLDGLWDAFENCHMGITAENVAERLGVSRQQADAYALRSHQRAAVAAREGAFAGQIVPVPVAGGRGEPVLFDRDEHVRADASLEALAALEPAFRSDGIVTAGNASGIGDGAAMMLVSSERDAAELRLAVAGRMLAWATVGVDPALMGLGTIPAIRKALARAKLEIGDVDLFEINEAFAPVVIAASRELGIPDDKLNPLGGAVAMGHPIGATGAILVVKLLHEIDRRSARYGVVALCIGGGMGIAAVFERPTVTG